MSNEYEKTKFPSLKRTVENFMYEEEGNITRNKILIMGSMVIIMGIILYQDIFAAHRSHSSHKSHSSHGSGSSGTHRSHVSHTSHSSARSGSGNYSGSSSGGSSGSSGSTYTYFEPTTVTTTEYVPAASSIGVPKVPEQTGVSTTVPDVNAIQAIPDTPKVK